jgi:hypothetical protein
MKKRFLSWIQKAERRSACKWQMDLPSDWRAHPIDWPLPDKILLFANSSRSSQQSYRYYLLDTNTGETREVLKEVRSIKGIPDWFAGGS